MGRRRRTNIRRRGDLWIVHWRRNGRQLWKSFPTEEQAELFASKHVWPRRAREEYEPPEKVLFSVAAEEWYRHGCLQGYKRGPWKASTARDYRCTLDGHLLPAFGELYLEQVTARVIDRWRTGELEAGMGLRTAAKLSAVLHGIFERGRRKYRLRSSPFDGNELDALNVSYSGRLDFYSVEEVWALVRAADSEQDAAIFLTAAFTGLRMGELLALRWRDIDWQAELIRVDGSVSFGERTTPKSGKGRAVPMVPEVAKALDGLSKRQLHVSDDDPVFPGERGYLDGSALRRRFKTARNAAGLRPLTFHHLRHCFGSLAINAGSIVDVQTWMGHADVKTTMRYLHYKRQPDAARRLAGAFAASGPQATAVLTAANGFHGDSGGREEIPLPVGVAAEPSGTAGTL